MVSERRHATVLFSDISGFTAAAEKLDPEELTDVVNSCFAIMESAVREHGGHVDKYTGDCVVAIFGAPAALEHAARQAVNAAIEMRNRLAIFCRDRRVSMPLSVHMGINSGLVLAGDVGGEVKKEFTVMGDTVNIASRLKDAAPSRAIWVGHQTHLQTRADFEYRPVARVAAKGKEERLEVWEVVSTIPRVYRSEIRVGRTVGSDMVGRQDELGTLVQAVDRLCAGAGGVVAVLGEAGIGKSRLLAALRDTHAVEGATVLEGRCLAMGANLSFHPFVDLLRRWAGVGESDPDAEALRKLESAIAKLMPDGCADVFPFVATLMRLRRDDSLVRHVEEGEGLEELIFQRVRQLLRRLSQERPLVLVFEDLHWADRSSIRLLSSLLRLVPSEALLLALVGRPDFPETLDHVVARARAERGVRCVEIALVRLSDPECEFLMRNLLGGQDLPYPVRAPIIERADGNPFFIEEAVRSLIDEGAVRGDGRFEVTDRIESVVIPGSIQDVLMARVDRLAEPTREVLHAAAVVGRFFEHRVLSEIVGPGISIDAHLQILIERQMIVPRSSHHTGAARRPHFEPEQGYVFKHALLQETVYEAILQRTRRDMHRRVVETIERLFAGRLVDSYPMLAYHCMRAELLEKAEEYLFKAGEEAARVAASNEALTFFREGAALYLHLHGDDGGSAYRRGLLEKNIALALLNTGNLTESIEHFDRALEYWGLPRKRSTVGRLLTFGIDVLGVLTHFYVKHQRPRQVQDWDVERDIFQTLLNRGRAEITSDQTRLFLDSVGVLHRMTRVDATRIDQASIVYASAGSVFAYSGISFDVTRRALEVAKRLRRPGSVRDQFTCASLEFIFDYLRGEWGDGCVVDRTLVEQALRAGQLWDVSTYIGLYCDRRLRQGDYRGAEALLGELSELDDTYGFSFAGANHLITKALWLVEQRHLREALPLIESYHLTRHEDALKVLGLGTQAKAQALLGDLDGARGTLAAAARITSRARDISPWHLSAYVAAQVRYDVGELEAGGGAATVGRAVRSRLLRNARTALRVAERAAVQRTEIYQLVGRLLWLLGRRSGAIGEWRKAVKIGAAQGARPELARTYAEIARSVTEAADPSLTLDGLGAEVCLDRAAELFIAVGAEFDRAWANATGRAAA